MKNCVGTDARKWLNVDVKYFYLKMLTYLVNGSFSFDNSFRMHSLIHKHTMNIWCNSQNKVATSNKWSVFI